MIQLKKMNYVTILLLTYELFMGNTSVDAVKGTRDIKKIFYKLLDNYDPKIAPVINSSLPLEVAVGIYILDFVPLKAKDLVRDLFCSK